MRAHFDDYETRAPFKFGEPTFRMAVARGLDGVGEPDIVQTCSFCGSMTIDDVVKYAQIPGTEYSGSDWKYGWPHKFYISIPCDPYERAISGVSALNGEFTDIKRAVCTSRHHKFYSVHLRDATPEQLERWNAIVAPLLGIKFDLHPEKGLGWTGCPGYQSHGVV